MAASRNLRVAVAGLLYIMLKRRERRRLRWKNRQYWTKPWLLRRSRQSLYVHLVKELSVEDPDIYRSYMRMSPDCFGELLEKIRPHILRKDTKLREAIAPEQRLALTLRFLATEIFDTFKVFDKNGDGMITKEELGTVMVALGQRPTVRELRTYIRAVDSDRNETIDFEEFLKIFSQKLSVDPEKELYEVFCVFDNDKDGFISPSELYDVLSRLGEKITREEARQMVREADLNGDGKVDYKEFKAILSSKG